MEKGKRVEGAEFPLPEFIIQHVQSFLNAKQAAQTSILSKSWYNAWLTRPILALDELNFTKHGDGDPESQIADGFSEFAKKTMQRYEDLNLKIDSFRLWMKNISDRNSLANELITKALKMGVADLDFEINRPDMTFVLPHEVLGSKNLIRLSVTGCTIDRRVDGKINCSRLKSLSLNACTVNDTVWDIISSFPLIEKLLLWECWWECECLAKGNTDRNVTNMWTWRNPSNESSKFHRLKYLSLFRQNIDELFFHDFSRKFPCLEDLGIDYCEGYEEVQISSHSLKCISLSHMMYLRAHFDVPNIHNFNFIGPIPSLFFARASGEWESKISITPDEYHMTSEWFFELKTLLKNMSQSKISLSVDFWRMRHIDFVGQIGVLPGPVVENLSVSVQTPWAVSSSLLDGLFWICRPKFITQYWSRKSSIPGNVNEDFLELLCKTLIPEVSQNCCILDLGLSGLHGLEEYVEVFEHTHGELRPVPWKSFLDASRDLENDHEIRFRLKWGSPQVSNIPSCERVL